MFNKILIANRGEIAVRIIRACIELGIKTVAIYSTADKDSLHVKLADESVCVGSPKATDSYLNMQNIISAAYITKCDAIHPGFGFLSENSIFASLCLECNIKFIGPCAESIELMGNKANAKELMKKAGIPLIPGSSGIVETIEEAYEICEKIKYPVVIKAVHGGGGKGIRRVNSPVNLKEQFSAAKNEAKTAFGNGDLYIEKVIQSAKHIEVQILADEHGNVVHLGERDCSIQERNQKIIEECPATVLTEKKRKYIGELCVKVAKICDYKNAGTIEFLYDKEGNFYFLEMNTRIQVEHPITEMVCNIDIVKEQIKIAMGKPLNLKQKDIVFKGHSIEFRINAKTAGKINYLHFPAGTMGLRVDSAIYSGATISPYYDSMIAKIITHAPDREKAILKMNRAIKEFSIEGIITNKPFLEEVLKDKNYINANFNTSYIEEFINKK